MATSSDMWLSPLLSPFNIPFVLRVAMGQQGWEVEYLGPDVSADEMTMSR